MLNRFINKVIEKQSYKINILIYNKRQHIAIYNESHVMIKPNFCLCKNKGAGQLCSNYTTQMTNTFVFAIRTVQCLFFFKPNFKLLTIFCSCTGRFVSDLVGSPNDRFSHVTAHIINSIFKQIDTVN